MKYIEINSENLIHNIKFIKSKLKHGVLFCAVVKSNAYGHGFKICKLIEKEVDYFAVATPKEAIILRNLGIKKNILVLGITTKEEKLTLIKEKIDITISSFSELYQIVKYPARIHLKINTGMNRIGFSSKNEVERCLKLLYGKSVKLVGVFSHLYDANNYELALKQNNKFLKIVDTFPSSVLKHISSTDAIFCSSEFNHSMVRCGIGMYGYTANKKFSKMLKPVMKVYGEIIQKRWVKKGEGVSYCHKFIASKKHQIAVVNCGYNDGFFRCLSNNKIKNNENIITICGNICMDMMMVKLEKAFPNMSCVCLLENAEVLAKICNTIPYEILTNIKHDRFEYIIK